MNIWKNLGTIAFWLTWPLLYVYLRSTKRTRLLVICKDEILLTKGWLGPDEWSLPGGGLNRKEDPADGAIREIYEETGLNVEKDQLKYLELSRASMHGLRFKCHYFICAYKSKPKATRSSEVVAMSWFNRRELLAQRLTPDSLLAINKFYP